MISTPVTRLLPARVHKPRSSSEYCWYLRSSSWSWRGSLLHHNLFVYPFPFSSFQRKITGHPIRRFVRRRSDHNAVGSTVSFPLSYFHFRFLLCSIGVHGRDNFFFTKIPQPSPPNVPSLPFRHLGAVLSDTLLPLFFFAKEQDNKKKKKNGTLYLTGWLS